MIDYTPEQFARLPKWAQRHIEFIETRNVELKAALDEARQGGLTESRLTAQIMYGEQPLLLPEHAQVRFRVGEDRDAYIEARLVGHEVEIRTAWGGLTVQAYASNVIRVRTPER